MTDGLEPILLRDRGKPGILDWILLAVLIGCVVITFAAVLLVAHRLLT